ncbi:hypothetical protein VNI00_013998 [Paramarasmius palmivorus]|uniref:Uncharacterized protein n=1 Tax=Paramarasmius palmivorus TaxID=297713 RepID=A0AAW0BXD0_9AGAR
MHPYSTIDRPCDLYYKVTLEKGERGFLNGPLDMQLTAEHAKGADILEITEAYRDVGQSELPNPPVTKELKRDDDIDRLVDTLHRKLMSIPMESPAGSEDIYQMKTYIQWENDGGSIAWANRGKLGCTEETRSLTKPDEKQKKDFVCAVDIINKLVKERKDWQDESEVKVTEEDLEGAVETVDELANMAK